MSTKVISEIIFVLFLITGMLSIYSGASYYKLHAKGIAVIGGRPTLRKIKAAKLNAKTKMEIELVDKCMLRYKAYLYFFCVAAFSGILIVVINASRN